MFSSMTYRLLFISATLLLSGCFAMLIGSCNDEDCSAPAEFISEIQTLGVTASTSTRPLVETVDTHIFVRESDNEAFVSGNGISLYFSPAMEFATVEDPASQSSYWADHPYVYTFSQKIDGVFEKIKPDMPFNTSLLQDGDFAPLAVTDYPEELIVFGNHILEAQALFPVRATHIEIWFRRERSQEFTLMKRTPLDSLLYSPSCPTHC